MAVGGSNTERSNTLIWTGSTTVGGVRLMLWFSSFSVQTYIVKRWKCERTTRWRQVSERTNQSRAVRDTFSPPESTGYTFFFSSNTPPPSQRVYRESCARPDINPRADNKSAPLPPEMCCKVERGRGENPFAKLSCSTKFIRPLLLYLYKHVEHSCAQYTFINTTSLLLISEKVITTSSSSSSCVFAICTEKRFNEIPPPHHHPSQQCPA
jgi:hypothetical protein